MAEKSRAALVLASASPRRRELLDQIGIPFEVIAAPDAEDEGPKPGEWPVEYALRQALSKAKAVAKRTEGPSILAADTVVVLDGRPLGKPRDASEAHWMLKLLRGQTHRVITAIAYIHSRSKRPTTLTSETTVRFRDYTDAEIEAYIASGAPMDKAGAYGVQDEALSPAAEVTGCLHNVIGLPSCLVAKLVAGSGFEASPKPSFTLPEPCKLRRGGCFLDD